MCPDLDLSGDQRQGKSLSSLLRCASYFKSYWSVQYGHITDGDSPQLSLLIFTVATGRCMIDSRLIIVTEPQRCNQ
ncbi:hypothetical protein BaRGS_00021127, partial [Batillaria attramentaria]